LILVADQDIREAPQIPFFNSSRPTCLRVDLTSTTSVPRRARLPVKSSQVYTRTTATSKFGILHLNRAKLLSAEAEGAALASGFEPHSIQFNSSRRASAFFHMEPLWRCRSLTRTRCTFVGEVASIEIHILSEPFFIPQICSLHVLKCCLTKELPPTILQSRTAFNHHLFHLIPSRYFCTASFTHINVPTLAPIISNYKLLLR
jgi:hypothetical protein